MAHQQQRARAERSSIQPARAEQVGPGRADGASGSARCTPDEGVTGPAPVSASAISYGVSDRYRAEVAKAEELLERRLADTELVLALRNAGFAGSRYERFANDLAAYGLSVMRGWLHSGYVFALTKSRGYPLHPHERDLEQLAASADHRDQLATMTVARALPSFRDRALIAGGWRPEGGASITTYFMGACAYSLPGEFRRWQGQQIRWRGQDAADERQRSGDRNDSHVTDAASIAVGNLRVREDLERLPWRTRAAVMLSLDGWSQAEIAEVIGADSVRAVEGVMYRWRKAEQQHLRERA